MVNVQLLVKIRTYGPYSAVEDVTTRPRRRCKKILFKQNWRHHHGKHLQSGLTCEICSKKPVKWHIEAPFEEKVGDGLHYHS